jgi:cyanate permease
MRATRARRAPVVRLGVLLTVAMVVAVIGQFGLGALGPFIRADLGLTRGELGFLSLWYYVVVAGLSVVVSRLVGRTGDRSGLAAIFLLTAGGAASPWPPRPPPPPTRSPTARSCPTRPRAPRWSR